jgi:transcriptional regulator with XRE-family HTH domain
MSICFKEIYYRMDIYLILPNGYNELMENIISERLRLSRINTNMTQHEVADIADIEPGSYGRYERGERILPADILAKLADCFNVSTDYLLGRVDNPNYVLWDKNLPKELLDNDIDAMIIDKELADEINKSGLSKDELRAIIKLANELRGKAPD